MKELYRPESSAYIHTHIENTLIGRAALEAAIANQFPLETATLMSIAIASHAASIAYKVESGHDKCVAIGLYALAEQSSGTGKSEVLEYYQAGFVQGISQINEQRAKIRKQILQSEKDKKGDLDDYEVEKLAKNQHIRSPFTDTTPEALDHNLISSDGWFAGQSSEQGLVQTLMGNIYASSGGNSSNKDGLLLGFKGESGTTMRITREGYAGMRHGGIAVMSQDGTIDSVVRNSESSGLAERFLMVLEGTTRGHRKGQYFGMKCKVKYEYLNQIKAITLRCLDNESLNFADLKTLRMSKGAKQVILEQFEMIEEEYKPGGKYDSIILAGMASKMHVQIRKIAATIHLMEGFDERTEISKEHTRLATLVVKELINGVIKICEEKGVVGKSSEVEAIEDYMAKNAAGLNGKTMRDIQNSLSKRKIFKEYGKGARQKIEDGVNELVDKNILMRMITGQNKRETFKYIG